MAQNNLNTVAITGNLTRDPELRSLPSGTAVCRMRVAYNRRERNGSTGNWDSRANYINVDVFGGRAETCAKFLSKGSGVGVTGQLRWREWEASDGSKREETAINADNVQFLDSAGGATGDGEEPIGLGDDSAPAPPAPVASEPVAAAAGEDDIPF
jgi:single-strand DNA-binding protein